MRTARQTCCLLAVLCVFGSAVAFAQQMQFPSPIQSTVPAPTATQPPPGTFAPAPMGAPSTAPMTAPVPGPAATFDGTIQPPPQQWDPYACPGSTPPALLPQDPYFQYGPPNQAPAEGITFQRVWRAIDDLRLDYVWMPGNGIGEFGINDIETSVTFPLPFFGGEPIRVTPGFALHLWSGPKPDGSMPEADLPSKVFDAYLDTAWNPQMTQWFGAELSFRVGIYSDFRRITNDSLRYTGTGLAVLSFSPSIKLKAGIWYLDRIRVKILPAGGIVWTPNSDTVVEVLFPNPRFARRLANYGNTEWWFTLRGEYGGGNWTVKRDNPLPAINGMLDSVDYNDIRVGTGLEFINETGVSGLFEVGVAFEREIRYRSQMPVVYYPNTTVFVRGGLSY